MQISRKKEQTVQDYKYHRKDVIPMNLRAWLQGCLGPARDLRTAPEHFCQTRAGRRALVLGSLRQKTVSQSRPMASVFHQTTIKSTVRVLTVKPGVEEQSLHRARKV